MYTRKKTDVLIASGTADAHIWHAIYGLILIVCAFIRYLPSYYTVSGG